MVVRVKIAAMTNGRRLPCFCAIQFVFIACGLNENLNVIDDPVQEKASE